MENQSKANVISTVIIEKLRKNDWSEENRNEMANRVNNVVNTIEKKGITLLNPRIFKSRIKNKSINNELSKERDISQPKPKINKIGR